MSVICGIFPLIAVVASQSAFAADLFADGKLVDGVNTQTVLDSSHTIGGYPILQPGGVWRFGASRTATAAGSKDTVNSVPLGSVAFVAIESGNWVGEMQVEANLQSGNSGYWSGDPCGGSHLAVNKKVVGRDDNCLTIDYLQQSNVLRLDVTQSSHSGRYYHMFFFLSPKAIGFRDTKPEDWRETSIQVAPSRAALLKRLTAWGIQLQDATRQVFETKKADAFNVLPSYRTVINAPQEFVQQKVSTTFLSVLADVQDNKPGYRAVAYLPRGDYKTRWGFAWGRKSKEDAEAEAIDACEKDRQSYEEPCKIALSFAP